MDKPIVATHMGSSSIGPYGDTTLLARRHKSGWRVLVKHNGKRLYRGNSVERAQRIFNAACAGELVRAHTDQSCGWQEAQQFIAMPEGWTVSAVAEREAFNRSLIEDVARNDL